MTNEQIKQATFPYGFPEDAKRAVIEFLQSGKPENLLRLSNNDLDNFARENRCKMNGVNDVIAAIIEDALECRVKNRHTPFTADEMDAMRRIFGNEPHIRYDGPEFSENVARITDGDLQITVFKLRNGGYNLYYDFEGDMHSSDCYETDTLDDLPEMVRIAYGSRKNGEAEQERKAQ